MINIINKNNANKYFTCKKDFNFIRSLHDCTKSFLLLIYHMNIEENIIRYGNNKPIKSLGDLKKYLKISNDKWNKYIKLDIEKYNIIKKEKIDNKWYLLLNPIYSNIYTKISFDVFKDVVKEKLNNFEYLKIKSKWYEIDEENITVNNIKDLKCKVSGIYRLYKNNKIVYIGKSKCIKTRIQQHLKEKDIDGFDFTILDNESDKNLYEIYYIDKYKPVYNKDCIEDSAGNIKLKDIVFSNFILF